jgi:hypothetical protein
VLPIWWIGEDGACACGQCDPGSNNAGKHPITELVSNGMLSASTSVAVITAWWGAYPRANVAVACRESGLVVIDVDPRHGGDETWAFIESRVDLPAMPRARTSGGGWHHYLRDSELRARVEAGGRATGKLGPGVDVKWNGYVLAPPSKVVGWYTWESTGQVPTATGELLESLLDSRKVGPSSSGDRWGPALDLEEIFAGVPEGERHSKFVSYAASMRARRVREVEARQLITAAWEECAPGDHPFPLEEALRILTDMYDRLPEGTTWEAEDERNLNFVKNMLSYDVNGTITSSTLVPADESGTEVESNGITGRLLALPDGLREASIREFMRREAARVVQQLIAGDSFEAPPSTTLAAMQANGVRPIDWIIESVHARGTNSTLTAQYKAGKTTMLLNMMRALVDGVPFLGTYRVNPLSGNVAFFNYELSEEMFIEWASRLRIRDADRIHVLNLRGYRLDLGDEAVAEWTERWLREREIEFWFIDPLARAYYGHENDNTELKLWTDALDVIKRRAGVTDTEITAHTGRAQEDGGPERARGATRIDDWTDDRHILNMLDDTRFWSRRNVRVGEEIPDTRLLFDPDTWSYSVDHNAPVSRSVHRRLVAIEHVIEVARTVCLGADNAVSARTLRDALHRGSTQDRASWIASAIATGDLRWRQGRTANSKEVWVEDE